MTSPTRLRTLAATATLTVALTAPLGGAAQAAPAAKASPESRFAARTHALVNAERVDHGVRTLRKDTCLTRSAQRQARRMADQRRLFHSDLGAVLRACRLGSAGENVASGYPTPAATVRGWMGSPGHRDNILGSGYRVTGVGAVKAGGRWYVAQVFGRR